MFKEFKQFAMRGNVLDMTVGIMVGGAFGKIVTSLVNDILMPPMGLILGKVNFSNLFLNLSSRPVQSVEEAKAAGIPTVNYGLFLNTLLDFLIVSFAIFLLVRQVNRLFPKPVPSSRQCPFCFSTIAVQATRCAHCTSHLNETAEGARA